MRALNKNKILTEEYSWEIDKSTEEQEQNDLSNHRFNEEQLQSLSGEISRWDYELGQSSADWPSTRT